MVLLLEEKFGDHIFKLSGQIGSVFGLAVALFLGFRMNSAYDRWWEARKIFGELTNNARYFSGMIYTYFRSPSNFVDAEEKHRIAIARELIELICRHINQLRNELHCISQTQPDKGAQLHFNQYGVKQSNELSNEILTTLSAKIEAVFAPTARIVKSDPMLHIIQFYDVQGKAKRINNTPFLKIYSAGQTHYNCEHSECS